MKAWIILFFLAFACLAQAQDSTLVRVDLKLGNSVQGTLSHQNDKSITINIPETGLMTIPWENIQTVTHLGKSGNSTFPNPQPTRYFFGPSAICLLYTSDAADD